MADRRAKKEEKRKAKRQKLQEKRAAEEEQLCEMGLWFLFKNTMLDKDKDAGGWTPRPQASNGYRVVPLDLHKYPVRLAVEKFIEAHNRCVHQGPAGEVGIDVVHGYSTEYRSHCIKNAIRRLCGLYSEKMHFMPGEAYDRNGGHTLVVPVGLLPYLTDQLFDRLVGDWPPGPDR